MKQTIAIINQKGGVGKTTTTINLAAYLAKQDRRVLVIDGDPQANATSGLGIDKSALKASIKNVLLDGISLQTITLETSTKNVWIAPAEASLASAEIDLATAENREEKLKKALELTSDFDYILIDCPPALGLLTVNALTAAEKVLIPVQAEYYALEGLSQLLQVMSQVSRTFNPDLELFGVLMTMYDKRNSLSEQVYDEVKKHFGDKLFDTVIPRNVRLAEAPSYGTPISEHDRWSKGAKAYKKLAKEVATRAA